MWTDEEIDQLIAAIRKESMSEVTRLVTIFQQRIPGNDIVNSEIKTSPHFLVAFHTGIAKLIDFYLSHSPELTRLMPSIQSPQRIEGWKKSDLMILHQLYNGLEMTAAANKQDVVDLLLKKYHFDPNFILPTEHSFLFRRNPEINIGQTPLIFRISNREMFQFLLAPEYKVNINLTWQQDGIAGVTLLFSYLMHGRYELAGLVLAHGADPFQELVIKRNPNSTGSNKYTDIKLNLFQMLEGNPQKQQQFAFLKQWVETHPQNEYHSDSSNHSSGSNTPKSTGSGENSPKRDGSPLGTPPGSSVIPDSPPRVSGSSQSSSASGSPTGSPPKDAAEQSNLSSKQVIYTINKNLPHDEFEKKFFASVGPETPLEHLKEYYFSGIKLDWYFPKKGDNAFQRAVDAKYFSVAEAMLSWGVNINILDSYGRNIIQRLSMSSRELDSQCMDIERLEFVFKDRPNLREKLNINYQDKDGNTALHLAAAKGADEVVAFLLKHGADPRINNGAGSTAEQCADRCQNLEKRAAIKAALKSHNSRQTSSVVSRPAEIQYRAAAPVANYYGDNNSALIFSNRASTTFAPLQTTTPTPQQIGAIYVSPPLSAAQLPRPIKKSGQIMTPQAVTAHATTNADGKKSNPSAVVTNKIRSFLGK